MELELYFYQECGFSQRVLSVIKQLHLENKITFKNIRENPAYLNELLELCGNKQVPTLVIDGEPMRESQMINRFLIEKFGTPAS